MEETVVCHAGRSTAQMWVWRKHEKCAKQKLYPFARAEEVSNICVQNKSKTTYPRKISRLPPNSARRVLARGSKIYEKKLMATHFCFWRPFFNSNNTVLLLQLY